MALGDSLARAAAVITAKFGHDATYAKVSVGSYNTTTGKAIETNATVGVRVVVRDVARREVDDQVRADDKIGTIAANDLNGYTPTQTDRLIIGGKVYEIVRIDTTEQDGVPVTYDLTLRA